MLSPCANFVVCLTIFFFLFVSRDQNPGTVFHHRTTYLVLLFDLSFISKERSTKEQLQYLAQIAPSPPPFGCFLGPIKKNHTSLQGDNLFRTMQTIFQLCSTWMLAAVAVVEGCPAKTF